MPDPDDLDETTYPAWRDAILAHQPTDSTPRSYPGVPRLALPRPRSPGLGAMSLARALATRRSAWPLGEAQPPAALLGRVLAMAHGLTGDEGRGPVPSAGNLQALELYLAVWSSGWLAPGWYHFDRAAHALAELVAGATRDAVAAAVPSLALHPGGALAWIAVADLPRVAARYGARATRFVTLEAGALLQNLALASTAERHSTVLLGGFFERALARRLSLPRGDRVVAVAAFGKKP